MDMDVTFRDVVEAIPNDEFFRWAVMEQRRKVYCFRARLVALAEWGPMPLSMNWSAFNDFSGRTHPALSTSFNPDGNTG